MNYQLRPYLHSRKACLPWLDTVPATWHVRRAKYLFSSIDARSETGSEELLTVSSADGVRKRSEKTVTMFLASSYLGYKLCWPRDLVINSLWAWATGFGFSKHHGIVSSAYGVYRLNRDLAEDFEFFHHLLRSRIYDWEFTVRSKGIWVSRLQLTDESFLDMPILLPPSEDRKAIVRFIRHLDQRVNQLIQAKRQMIGLLNEQKQAIIQQAVTRGINTNVRLKPSGVEWLGEVPEHWNVMPLRLRYSVELGKMLDAQRITGEALAPYLRNTDVQWDEIRTDDLPQMDIQRDEYSRYMVCRGDLMVCEGGEVGRAAIWSGDDYAVGYQKALHRLRPLNKTNDCPRFLMHLLFNVAKSGIFKADGSVNTIAHLTGEKFRAYRFAFPPFAEQIAIVEQVDRDAELVTRAVQKATAEIELLREYRTRLVADVVTGQLDVRHLDLGDVIDEPFSLIDEPVSLSDEPDDLADVADDDLVEAAV